MNDEGFLILIFLSPLAVVVLDRLIADANIPRISRGAALAVYLPGFLSTIFLAHRIWDHSTYYLGMVAISADTIVIISATYVAGLCLLLMIPQRLFSRYASLLMSPVLMLLILATTTKLTLAIATLSIGSLVVSYMVLAYENDPGVLREVTRDFLWQRISDFFLGMSAVLLALTAKSPHLELAACLFWVGSAMRILSISSATLTKSSQPRFRFALGHLLVSLGAVIFFYRFGKLAKFSHEGLSTYFAIALIAHASMRLVFGKKAKFINNLTYVISASAVMLVTLQLYWAAQLIIAAVIAIIPVLSVFLMIKAMGSRVAAKTGARPRENLVYDTVTMAIPTSISLSLAQVFSQILVPLYSTFLLFRLPQILIIVLQTPLRLFHSGQVQRTLFFSLIFTFGFLFWRSQWL